MNNSVLVVNDNRTTLLLINAFLNTHGIEPLEAETLTEARVLFTQHQNVLKVVVMDGHVDEPLDNTLALVREMRKQAPHVVLMAFSSNENHKLMAAGCMEKFDIGETPQMAQAIASLLQRP